MSSPSSPGEKEEPLDKDAVARLRIEASQGDTDFFPQYLEFFRQDLEEAANGLVTAASERNAYQLQAVAHRLRGAAGNFGAHPLIDSCALVEELAEAGRVTDALAVLPILRAELQRVELAIIGLSLG